MIESDLMTPNECHIMLHALGLNRSSTGYRNHFVTGEWSKDYADCESLVAKGLMWRKDGSELTGGDFVYYVTDAGRAAVDV